MWEPVRVNTTIHSTLPFSAFFLSFATFASTPLGWIDAN
jgi:hypothetical protein